MIYNENIFTKIVQKKIVTDILFENDSAIAINDINPRAKIHILLIPKNNYVNYYDFINKSSSKEQIEFNDLYKQIVEHYRINQDHNIKINNGQTHGQEVFHMHMHILSNL